MVAKKVLVSLGTGLAIYSASTRHNDNRPGSPIEGVKEILWPFANFAQCQNVEIQDQSLNQQESVAELTLKSVQVLFRHGARTPLRHLPGIDEVTLFCLVNPLRSR